MTERITLAGVCLTLAVLAKAESFAVLEVPGAVFTSANGILSAGEVIGNWTDSNGNMHGFIRGTDGGFTKIDVPGASSTTMKQLQSARHDHPALYGRERSPSRISAFPRWCVHHV